MASTILLKKSSTSGSAPTTSDLQAGEIAINLADRKIYVEDGGGTIVTMGVYVDSTAPANPVEGDLWYDTSANILKSHNGTAFGGVGDLTGLATVAGTGSYNDLTNKPTIPTNNNQLTNGAGYITGYTVTQGDVTGHQTALTITESQISDLQNYITGYTVTQGDVTAHQGALSITESQISDLSHFSGNYADLTGKPTIPTNNASLANGAGYITGYTVSEADVTGHQAALSVTESQISDLQSYALPADIPANTGELSESGNLYFTTARAQGAFTGSTGVGIVSGTISIGQDVSTTANVTFNNIIADGNLTVNGTVTAVNSTEVNIGDATILLNSGETSTPSLDAGFEVERGTSANVSFVWDETNDQFTVGAEKLKAGTLEGLVDGGSY